MFSINLRFLYYEDFRQIYTPNESVWLDDDNGPGTTQSWATYLNLSERTVYWRVKARYAAYPSLESVSATGSFFSYSCPILYTWNGEEYVFVTDIVAGSNIGLEVAPGKYIEPAPDEQVVITGSQLKEKDGFYSIKLKNELNEIDYGIKGTLGIGSEILHLSAYITIFAGGEVCWL